MRRGEQRDRLALEGSLQGRSDTNAEDPLPTAAQAQDRYSWVGSEWKNKGSICKTSPKEVVPRGMLGGLCALPQESHGRARKWRGQAVPRTVIRGLWLSGGSDRSSGRCLASPHSRGGRGTWRGATSLAEPTRNLGFCTPPSGSFRPKLARAQHAPGRGLQSPRGHGEEPARAGPRAQRRRPPGAPALAPLRRTPRGARARSRGRAVPAAARPDGERLPAAPPRF